MKKNEKLDAFNEHKKARWAMRMAILTTALATAFGWSNRNNSKNLDLALDREAQVKKSSSAEVSALKKQLSMAQARAAKAEKLNQQAWMVLADTMPVYTTEVDGMTTAGEKEIERENAQEEAKFKKNCKAMNIDPVKLKALHDALQK